MTYRFRFATLEGEEDFDKLNPADFDTLNPAEKEVRDSVSSWAVGQGFDTIRYSTRRIHSDG